MSLNANHVLNEYEPNLELANAVLESTLEWSAVSSQLRTELGEDVYTSWFARLKLENICQDHVTLSVPTRFLKSWLEAHYLDPLTKILQSHQSTLRRVSLVVRTVEGNNAAPVSKSEPIAKKSPHRSVPFMVGGMQNNLNSSDDDVVSSPLDKRYCFSSFFAGKSNALALAAAQECAECGSGKNATYNPLFVYGGVGLGKTHLVQAIANKAHSLGHRVVYLTAERFMFGFVSALKTQSAIAFKEALRNIDLLIVDDVQFLTGKSIQHEFGHTLNALIEGCRQVVVTADRRPSELEALDDRVRSRLGGGLVVEIGALDDELREKIVHSRIEAARHRHPEFKVSQGVVDFVVQTVTTNGRDLDGAVNRLLAHAMLAQSPLSVENASDAIRDLVFSGDSRRIRIEDIQRIVAQHFNVSRSDLLSARRTATVVRPRQIAIYLSKILTLRSLPEIGRRFGGRDHTTVLHAVRKIENLMESDARLMQDIERLKSMLQSC